MRTRKVLAVTLFLVSLLAGGGATALAQGQEPVRMEVKAPFGGHFVPTTGLQLLVRLENNGPDLEGEVVVQPTHSPTVRYVAPVSLPHLSRKEVPILVGPQHLVQYGQPGQFVVRLLVEGRVRAETRVSLKELSQNVRIGLWVQDRAPLSFLGAGGKTGQMRDLVPVEPADIPETFWPLHTVNVLLLAGVDTGVLTPAQRQALALWVQTGGHLIVCGGPAADLTLAGLPSDLLPVTLQGEATLEAVPALEAYVHEPIPPGGPYLLSRVAAAGEDVLLAEGTLPLIVSRPYGSGRVTFLALSPDLAPLRSWAGNEALWYRLIEIASVGSLWQGGLWVDTTPLFWALPDMIEWKPISVLSVGILLLVYILLVGPVNYLFLRRKQRLEWAWVTIPALTILFALAVYGAGLLSRGAERSLAIISVVRMPSGGQMATVSSYAALFSPRSQRYTITADPLTALGPLEEPFGSASSSTIEIVQQGEQQIRDLRVEQWSMRFFSAQRILREVPDLRARIVSSDRQTAAIRVENNSAYDLHDCAIVGRGVSLHLGEVAGGASIRQQVRIVPTLQPLQFLFPSGQSSSVWAPVPPGSLLNPYGDAVAQDPLLLCWGEGGPPLFTINSHIGRTYHFTLYLIRAETEPDPWMPGAGRPTPTPTPPPLPPPMPSLTPTPRPSPTPSALLSAGTGWPDAEGQP